MNISLAKSQKELCEFTNFLFHLIPQERADEISKQIEQFKKHDAIRRQLFDSEKCFLLLEKFYYTPYCTKISLMPEKIELVRHIVNEIDNDDLSYIPSEILNQIKAIGENGNFIEFVNNLIKCPENQTLLLSDESITVEQKTLISQCYSGECRIDASNIGILLSDKEDFKAMLLKYCQQQDSEQFDNSNYNEVHYIKLLQTSKFIHDLYLEDYKKCIASITKESGLLDWFSILDELRFTNRVLYYPYYNIISCFMVYNQVYVTDWKDSLYEQKISYILNAPDWRAGFINYLSADNDNGGSLYREVFCNCFVNYKDIDKLMELEKIKEIINDKRTITKNTGDKSWFKQIPDEKLKSGKSLEDCLNDLYEKLISKHWIPESTNLYVFKYRFSGKGEAFPLNETMEWKSEKATLGKMIRCLYETPNDSLITRI